MPSAPASGTLPLHTLRPTTRSSADRTAWACRSSSAQVCESGWWRSVSICKRMNSCARSSRVLEGNLRTRGGPYRRTGRPRSRRAAPEARRSCSYLPAFTFARLCSTIAASLVLLIAFRYSSDCSCSFTQYSLTKSPRLVGNARQNFHQEFRHQSVAALDVFGQLLHLSGHPRHVAAFVGELADSVR